MFATQPVLAAYIVALPALFTWALVCYSTVALTLPIENLSNTILKPKSNWSMKPLCVDRSRLILRGGLILIVGSHSGVFRGGLILRGGLVFRGGRILRGGLILRDGLILRGGLILRSGCLTQGWAHTHTDPEYEYESTLPSLPSAGLS